MTTTVTVQNHGPNDVVVKTKNVGDVDLPSYPDEVIRTGQFVQRHVYDTRTVEIVEVPKAS